MTSPKKIAKLFLIAAAAAIAPAAFAQTTVGQNFNVTASLVTRCVSNNASPTDLDFGAYTAFSGAATPAPTTSISFRCTRGLAATPSASLGNTTGSIAGLAYTLSVGTGTLTAAQSGAAGTSGTYDVYTYTVTGGMAANQAGDASASAVAQVQTLTISY